MAGIWHGVKALPSTKTGPVMDRKPTQDQQIGFLLLLASCSTPAAALPDIREHRFWLSHKAQHILLKSPDG